MQLLRLPKEREGEVQSVVSKFAGILKSTPALVLGRVCLLVGQIYDVLMDLRRHFRQGGRLREGGGGGALSAVLRLWVLLLDITVEGWESLLHENTSPIPRMAAITAALLTKGIGKVGTVPIPMEVWDDIVPPSFSATAAKGGVGLKPLSASTRTMLDTMRKANDTLFRTSESGAPANAWAFLVPKNLLKCSFIWHLVWFNKDMGGAPPGFNLPTLEDMAYLMHLYCTNGREGVWATHIDISNCFWSFLLPEHLQDAFRISLGGKSGKNISILRLPFGWKYSPILCQRILQFFLSDLKPGQILILHYLDDFMVLGVDRGQVQLVTVSVVEMLEDKGFLVSPKSKLEPTQELTWLGKSFDLVKGHVGNTDGGMLVGLAKWLILATGYCTRKRIQSAVGKFRWLARPHEYISPLLAGPCAHSLWGPPYLSHTPIHLLRSLASVYALGLTGWSPEQTTHDFGFRWDQAVFVDAAKQRGHYCYGLFGYGLGTRFGWCSGSGHTVGGDGVKSQMGAELFGLCQGIRYAVHRGFKYLILIGDNRGTIHQTLKLKAGVGFLSQQKILRKMSYMISRSGIQVKIYWVPSELMPADPISRYIEDFGGDMRRAEVKAREIAHALEGMEHEMEYMGRVSEARSQEERQLSKERDKENWERLRRMREWRMGQ